MTSEYINKIIENELTRMLNTEDLFLQHGLMGASVFFLWYYRLTNEKRYYELAKEALAKVCQSLRQNSFLEINNGFCGIAVCMIYFLKKGFIQGDINAILQEIDDNIYRNVLNQIDYNPNFSISGHENTLLDVILYSSIRLNNTELNPIERKIKERFILFVLNTLYLKQTVDLYLEPYPSSSSYKLFKFILSLSQMCKIDVCRSRVLHIINESEQVILSQIPYRESNRLLLYHALCNLKTAVALNQKWDEHIATLKSRISIKRIIENELPTNNLFITKGLAGVFLLLKTIPSEYTLSYDKNDFYNKIIKSDIYKNMDYLYLEKMKFIGLDGILGTIMLFNNIKKEDGKDFFD